MNEYFYPQTRIIDKILQNIDIEEEDINKIVKLIQDPSLSKYFFEQVENHIWIKHLFDEGVFYKIPKVKFLESGSYIVPRWHAIEFLEKYSNKYEGIVLEIVENTEISEWQYQVALLKALLKISSKKSATIISKIDDWINLSKSEMLISPLIELTRNFISNEFYEEALKILSFIIQPDYSYILDNPNRKSKFRIDNYWTSEYLDVIFPLLVKETPEKVFSIFMKTITSYIEKLNTVDFDEDVLGNINYKLFEINHTPTIGLTSEREYNDFNYQLVKGVRDSLDLICKVENKGEKYIKTLLSSNISILERIGLHALAIHGEFYKDLVDSTCFSEEFLTGNIYAREYNLLLKNQFKKLNQQKQVELLDKFKKNSENDKRLLFLYKLHSIKDDIPNEYEQMYLKLRNEYKGDIEGIVIDRPTVIADFVHAMSPIKDEELFSYTFEQLKKYLKEFTPEERDPFIDPLKGLAEAIKRLVSSDYKRYAEFSNVLCDDEIPRIYIYHYLLGIEQALEEKNNELSESVLDLCKCLIDNYWDKGIVEPQAEWGWSEIFLQISRLLKRAIEKNKISFISKEYLDVIKKMLFKLCTHPSPTIEEEIKISYGNAFTFSLNCVRGIALHGVIALSFFLSRKKMKNEADSTNRVIENDFDVLFTQMLDKNLEKSLAVHSVFGAHFPYLQFYFPKWAETNISKIFPTEPSLEKYWVAAWNAYLYNSPVYKDLFPILIPQYRKALVHLCLHDENVENKIFRPEPNKVMNHIIIAYLHGLTDFDHENQLLDLFYTCADDELRGAVGIQIVQALRQKESKEENSIWEKAWKLWKIRAFTAESDETDCCYDEELANLLRLLVCTPLHLDDTDLLSILRISIEKIQGNFVVGVLAEFLAKESKEYPKLAVQLLHKLVNKIIDQFYSYALKPELETTILTNALESEDNDAKDIALKIIDLHAWNGDFQWKDLWDKHYPI